MRLLYNHKRLPDRLRISIRCIHKVEFLCASGNLKEKGNSCFAFSETQFICEISNIRKSIFEAGETGCCDRGKRLKEVIAFFISRSDIFSGG